MRAEELWKAYCEKENIDIDTPYEAWGFGDAPDQLADLVLTGIKTATASAYDLYFMEGEEDPLPQSGDYSVILNSKDEAVCVIQTTKTTVVPFDEVSKEHAYKEGEGDRSLAYWRAVHEEFFTKEFEETKTLFLTSWMICIAYAASDELHQFFSPGRSPQIRDVVIDSFGALAGILLGLLLIRIQKCFQNSK